MPPFVFAVVLLAAVLHASWNAIVKSAPDKLMGTILVAVGTGIVAAIVLPFLPPLARPSWPFLAASIGLQIAYFVMVARTYQVADMSLAYPLMRGTAPMLVALTAGMVLHEHLAALAWLGVGLICAGILLALFASRAASRRGVGLALANAAIIATYTLIDAVGARRSESAVAYSLGLFLGAAIPMLAWALSRRRSLFIAYATRYWRQGLAGGIGATASYGLALWAMTVAPVALVAALRETSIAAGTLLAATVLKERVDPVRWLSAAVIVAGACALRLA
jgi:drug/metabolite transporter (DMT)-like permease